MKIDFLEELQPYINKFDRVKVVDGKLTACSPFRSDKNPSFVMWLDRGNWKDSGIGSAGDFFDLIAYLSGEDKKTVKNEIWGKYGAVQDLDAVQLELALSLTKTEEKKIIQMPKEFLFRHPYLENRGIAEAVQRGFQVGYDKNSQAVVIPWANKDGELVRLMFRSVKSKQFWFSAEGDRIKNHLFGLNHVYRKNATEVWLVEAPIDAMYLWTMQLPAIATGTASISKEQLKLLKRSPIERIIIATDNDNAGDLFKQKLVSQLVGIIDMEQAIFPDGAKDPNSVPVQRFQENVKLVGCHTFFAKS